MKVELAKSSCFIRECFQPRFAISRLQRCGDCDDITQGVALGYHIPRLWREEFYEMIP